MNVFFARLVFRLVGIKKKVSDLFYVKSIFGLAIFRTSGNTPQEEHEYWRKKVKSRSTHWLKLLEYFT